MSEDHSIEGSESEEHGADETEKDEGFSEDVDMAEPVEKEGKSDEVEDVTRANSIAEDVDPDEGINKELQDATAAGSVTKVASADHVAPISIEKKEPLPPKEIPIYEIESLGDKCLRRNMGQVYSGLYTVGEKKVPYIVIVKIGTTEEKSKPGNRGKRDSQMLVMRFLHRVHFDKPMSSLELEMLRQMRDCIGVHPSCYEYILMVDADTEVYVDSLNRLVSQMMRDSKIMGICGETKIKNRTQSWVTMIQVYEYYISHHMAKSFESLFGSVTCLPGCFSMYRIRSATKTSQPLLVAPQIIDDYSRCRVNTLHLKNLLHLAVIYGLQMFVFIVRGDFKQLAWMIVYMLSIPIFSFWLPLYSFWHFDDFSWGNTRVALGDAEKGNKQKIENNEDAEDEHVQLRHCKELAMDDPLRGDLPEDDDKTSSDGHDGSEAPGSGHQQSNHGSMNSGFIPNYPWGLPPQHMAYPHPQPMPMGGFLPAVGPVPYHPQLHRSNSYDALAGQVMKQYGMPPGPLSHRATGYPYHGGVGMGFPVPGGSYSARPPPSMSPMAAHPLSADALMLHRRQSLLSSPNSAGGSGHGVIPYAGPPNQPQMGPVAMPGSPLARPWGYMPPTASNTGPGSEKSGFANVKANGRPGSAKWSGPGGHSKRPSLLITIPNANGVPPYMSPRSGGIASPVMIPSPGMSATGPASPSAMGMGMLSPVSAPGSNGLGPNGMF
ncbi:hypothetical protein HDU76_008168, partial [Blyttiomyces sp. JEL0837]